MQKWRKCETIFVTNASVMAYFVRKTGTEDKKLTDAHFILMCADHFDL